MLERVKYHNGGDTFYNIFKHCIVANHQFISCDDLKVIGRNHRKNKGKQKTAEALLIKYLKTQFNVQEESVSLKLFNYVPWRLQYQ